MRVAIRCSVSVTLAPATRSACGRLWPDEVEIAELGPVALVVGGSCQGILDNCILQILVFQKVLGMKADVLLGGLETLGDFKLGKSDRSAFDAQG